MSKLVEPSTVRLGYDRNEMSGSDAAQDAHRSGPPATVLATGLSQADIVFLGYAG